MRAALTIGHVAALVAFFVLGWYFIGEQLERASHGKPDAPERRTDGAPSPPPLPERRRRS